MATSNPEKDTFCLPKPPEQPLDQDCCGSGCNPCVMDIYQEELLIWKAECEQLQKMKEGNKNTSDNEDKIVYCLRPDIYTSFTIMNITQETSNIIRIRCALASNQTLGLSLGQHIIVRSKIDDSYITRQYTPVSSVDAKGYFELLIKIYEEGHMSQTVKTWKAGNQLEARGPAGNFTYSRNKFSHILMLCAGTGVAPMCQVISSVLADEEDETFLKLVYSCRTYSELMAKSEIDEWRRYWNFSCVFMLTQEPDCPAYSYKYGEEICKGHVNRDVVYCELGNINKVLVLVCGTRSFDTDMMNYLQDIGVPQTNIHKF